MRSVSTKRRAAARSCDQRRLSAQQIEDLGRERVDVAGLEQHTGFLVADQLAVAADVGRHEQAALRHRLERLERRHEFGEAHRQSRIDQHVDEFVVAVHFVMGNATDEADLVVERQPRRNAVSSLASSGPPPTRTTRTRGSTARIFGKASSSNASPS